jgi:uncharacterized protein (DUF1501 family)
MHNDLLKLINRRAFLNRSAQGIGGVALASLLNPDLMHGAQVNGGFMLPHRAARAKHVIHLCMAGGASHLETFDYKPVLAEYNGKDMPESYTKGKPIAQLQGRKLKVLGPQHEFKKHGKGGVEVSAILPHIASVADDICVIKSVHTDQINHDPAHTVFNTGTSLPGRPSMGSWVNYAIGSECQDLPGYVVMTSVGGGQSQPIASRQWHSGFLPSKYQGVKFNSTGAPVYYVNNPEGVSRSQQNDVYGAIAALNHESAIKYNDPEIATRIAQYEMAAKMQLSVPGLMDASKEPKNIIDMYGCKPGDGSFASNCLLARRLVERGVRFVQLYHRGWDHHGGVKKGTANTAKLVDQGTAALIKDLKMRGLLQDTLIIWGGEFGRTPMAQGSGRDHHIQGYSMFMAGGGIKGGTTYGNTDELGYAAVVDKVHIRDLHATMLHQLGVDHMRLSVKFQGLDSRLTGVEPAKVINRVLA